jgi:hypothetical protein
MQTSEFLSQLLLSDRQRSELSPRVLERGLNLSAPFHFLRTQPFKLRNLPHPRVLACLSLLTCLECMRTFTSGSEECGEREGDSSPRSVVLAVSKCAQVFSARTPERLMCLHVYIHRLGDAANLLSGGEVLGVELLAEVKQLRLPLPLASLFQQCRVIVCVRVVRI